MVRIDWDAAARDYEAGRGIELEGLEDWRLAVARQLPVDPTLPIVDVGAGTGIWARAFAKWFERPIVAIEPSVEMRAQGKRLSRGYDIEYLAGDAQRLPIAAATAGAIWLSTVIHHIPDLAEAAKETGRVLAPGCPVLIRNAFPGRHHGISLFRFFPGAAAIANTFPTVETTVATFEDAGLRFEALESVPQVSAPNLAAIVERVRLRADSTTRPLSDDEFAAGMAALEAAAAKEHEPLIDWLDLLVLRKR
jgi:SAM-dependent methyltransferase